MNVSLSKSVKRWYIIHNKYIILVGIISGLDGAISCGMRPSYYYHHKIDKSKITKTNVYCLCSKLLNNTEAKLTKVPPHYFVIVIVIT